MRRAGWTGERGTALLLAVSLTCGAPCGLALAEPLTPEATPRLAARSKPKANLGRDGEEAAGSGSGESVFSVRRSPERPRSIFWLPFVSFLLPGFDQWLEGQYGSAAIYTGAAVGGITYAESVRAADNVETNPEKKKDDTTEKSESSEDEDDSALDSKDVALRKYTLGYLVYQGAGGMSAYHSFRTAVRTRKAKGQYEFLRHEETPLDVMAAPFHFEYLQRPTTFIPLGIGAALAYLVSTGELPKGYERDGLSSADWFFTGAYSYNAGTHEEAVFRGWLMPVLTEHVMSPFWANVSQAVLFAAAHLGTNPQPLPQLALGYHFGYVTQERGWRIGEAVFIHVWWDVLAFAAAFSYRKKHTNQTAGLLPPPALWLPPLTWQF